MDEQVALTGVPRRTLYRLIRGEGAPTTETVLRICDALDTQLEVLFERVADQ